VGEIKVGVRELFLGLGLIFLVVGIGFSLRGQLGQSEKIEVIEMETGEETISDKVYVEIAGGVLRPGVYEMKAEDRVNDLLVEAGGLSAEADWGWVEKNLNKARKLRDGEKIYIPRKGEEAEEISLNFGSQENGVLGGGQVNLNRAGREELETLTGIGPSLASRILEYREKNGEFKDINELKLVSGIGDKVFEKIKDQVGI
jgi:competence protein ComEA